MDKLRIVGGTPLHGEVNISGAKNAALPILCASLLTEEELSLRNVPELNDIQTTLRLLRQLGVTVQNGRQGQVSLRANTIHNVEAPYDLVKTMRASILVLGPLLARYGEAKVSLPGGCAIGQRPVDQHIKGLTALGADIRIEHGYVVARANRLKGTTIRTDMVTVTGTENLLMAATLAQGRTVLDNAACEPEIVDLGNLLNKMGARIQGHGTNTIIIDGVDKLSGAEHVVIPDRIEAGTFLCAVGATGGEVLLRNAAPTTMGAIFGKIRETGATLDTGDDWIQITANARPLATSFRTQEYPGFPTDMQAQLMALNTIAKGTSVVVENIFENRYMHVLELCRMGADIDIDGATAVIEGVDALSGTTVMATDLRASASLVIAGLVAQGETTIERIYHLDRGYECMENKLAVLGANIQRVSGSQ